MIFLFAIIGSILTGDTFKVFDDKGKKYKLIISTILILNNLIVQNTGF